MAEAELVRSPCDVTDGRGNDHMSQLPDYLVHRIFSLMPTKDVARFCSLSRRWYQIRMDVPSIDLHESLHTSVELHRFTIFMNRFLRRYSADKKLERFSLRLDRPCHRIRARIDPWIRFAVRRKVKELLLDLESYELPRFLCYCFWLERLSITQCVFPDPCSGFNWFHLKELSISQMQLSEKVLTNIFFGTQSLELLKLEGCRGLSRIGISISQRLSELVIDSNEGDSTLKIIAPNLRVLRLRGYWRCRELKLIDVSSVAEAELNFLLQGMEDQADDYYILPPQFFCHTFKEILDQLQHVSSLHIGQWCNEVISSMKEAGVDIREMTNTRHLIIDSALDGVDLIGITSLLERSPHVEKLELRRVHQDIDYKLNPLREKSKRAVPRDQDKLRTFPSGVSVSLEKHLKHVKAVILRWSDAVTGRAMVRAFDMGNGVEELVRSVMLQI